MTGFQMLLLALAAVGAGLVGGIFFAFSTFVMQALDRLKAEEAIAAMRAINITVINTLFFLAFFGTGVVALLLAALVAVSAGTAGLPVIAASALYVFGVIGVTMMANVPLNDALAADTLATDAPGAEAEARWRAYRDPWILWNHVRTLCALAASTGFVAAALAD